MTMTKEQVEQHIEWCWKRFDMEKMHEAYRSAANAMYAIGDQIAERDRAILRGELGEWEEYIPFEDESMPKFTPKTPFPRCLIKIHLLEGERVAQLSYGGALPLHFRTRTTERDKLLEIEAYQKRVKQHYLAATLDALQLLPTEQQPDRKQRAFIYICHFYKDLKIRDLDNRNRSVLINAARFGNLVDGDEWQKLSVMEEGFLDIDRQNHVSVFISSRDKAMKVVEYVNSLYQNGHRFRVELNTKNGLY